MLNFNKTKYVIVILAIVMIIGLMNNFAAAKEYDWDQLEHRYKAFIKNTNCQQQKKLLEVLPTEKVEAIDEEILEYVFRNLSDLKKLAYRGNSNAINSLFRMIYLTDGASTSWIQITLGKTIYNYPQEFLYALEDNFQVVTKSGLGSLVGNLGAEYVDNAEKSVAELERRYTAIKNIRNVPQEMRNLCLYKLSRQIFEYRKDIIYLNNNQKLLKKVN